jgi:hypothetical protein
MNSTKSTTGLSERLGIQEKALSNLADALKKHELESAGNIRDLQAELKALTLLLSRNIPEFKKQFPEIRRKVR